MQIIKNEICYELKVVAAIVVAAFHISKLKRKTLNFLSATLAIIIKDKNKFPNRLGRIKQQKKVIYLT